MGNLQSLEDQFNLLASASNTGLCSDFGLFRLFCLFFCLCFFLSLQSVFFFCLFFCLFCLFCLFFGCFVFSSPPPPSPLVVLGMLVSGRKARSSLMPPLWP